MGEVWRATDTKLGRDVAIKILPAAFASDPDRLSRFEREAQVLASLNHPNIAAIYGVEERALVMELVEGPTLAERIARGALPLDEALPVARQIAEALEYAHERGVVHRDLKPANIKVTPEGRVKILDFGLAKALASETGPGDPAASPTLTMKATAAGTILGTAAYMAPEQARGQNADRRADIWAFGVVLYEMLTGRQLFGAPTISDTLAAVLRTDVDVSAVPVEVRTVVERCLRKDVSRRWQASGDVRIALEEPPPAPPASQAPMRSSSLPWVLAAALAIALAATSVPLWLARRSPDGPLMRLNVNLGADSIAGNYRTVTISPDATRLVFLVRGADGRQQLATRLLSQSKATVLPGTGGATDPFFSPDGQSVGFFADGKLKTISVQGGAPATLAHAPSSRGGAWLSDGTIVAALALNGLYRVPAAGGEAQPLIRLPQTAEKSHRWPQVLPGGKAILLTSGVPGNFEDGALNVLDLGTGNLKTVVQSAYFGRYLPGGHLVYIRQGVLYGVRFDVDRLEVRGVPVPMLDDVGIDPQGGAAQFDFSETGALVYLTGGMQNRRLAWLDNAGGVQMLPIAPGPYYMPRVSPDGTQVAVWGAPAAPLDLWKYDWQRDRLSRLTFHSQIARDPVWTPDGKHIVYESPSYLGWVRADGAGGEQRLMNVDTLALPYSFSPDGRRLAYHQFSGKTDFDIWTVPIDLADPDHPKAGKPELFLGTPAGERYPAFSPDGRWMAYDSTETSVQEIYVRPFPSGSAKWQVSTGGGMFAEWSRDGRQLFFETTDGHIMVADCAAKGDSFEAGKPRLWSPKRIGSTFPYVNLSLHPDGKRFLVFPTVEGPGEAESGVNAVFVLNFFDELKRRIP